MDLGLAASDRAQYRPPPAGGDAAAAAPGGFKKPKQVVVASLNVEKHSVSRALLRPLDPILAAAPHPSRPSPGDDSDAQSQTPNIMLTFMVVSNLLRWV